MNRNDSIAFNIRKSNWNNNDIFPDALYVDANPIINIINNDSYGQKDSEYIQEVVDKGGMIIWSSHTVEEVKEYIHVNEYILYARENDIQSIANKKSWKVAEDTVSNAISIELANRVEKKCQNIFNTLEQFGFPADESCFSKNHIDRLVQYIYLNCGGSLRDSKHIAIANLNGINNIFSHDSGMLRYKSQNIFGASSNLIQNCKEGQAPVSFIDLTNLMEKKENEKKQIEISSI